MPLWSSPSARKPSAGQPAQGFLADGDDQSGIQDASYDDSADSGGGIYNNGTLTITGSTFDSNQCTEDGGGIYNTDTAAVSVSNSTFYFNSTSGIDSSRSARGGTSD